MILIKFLLRCLLFIVGPFCHGIIHKHNFSPHKYLIWNNKNIYIDKTFFIEYWLHNNIIHVAQLFNKVGKLLSYEEFLSEFNLHVPPGDYAKVFGAILSGICMLFWSCPNPNLQQLSLLLPTDTAAGKMWFSNNPRNNNKSIRTLFLKDIVMVPYVISYLGKYLDNTTSTRRRSGS